MAFNRAGVDGFGKRGVDQHRCDGRVSFFVWFPQPVDRAEAEGASDERRYSSTAQGQSRSR